MPERKTGSLKSHTRKVTAQSMTGSRLHDARNYGNCTEFSGDYQREQ